VSNVRNVSKDSVTVAVAVLFSPTGLLFSGFRSNLSAAKWLVCDAELSLSFSAEVKNEWSHTSTHVFLACTGTNLIYYLGSK
jgi:hypothetical protein